MGTKARKTIKKLKTPSAAMVRDLQALFKKHKWGGDPIGLTAAKAADANGCPEGTTPHTVTVRQQDGTDIVKTICL